MSSPIGSRDVYIPLASLAMLEEGSAPDESTKSSKWSKIGNWCKTNEKELGITALVIAFIAGIALACSGVGIMALAAYGSMEGILMVAGGAYLALYSTSWAVRIWQYHSARG